MPFRRFRKNERPTTAAAGSTLVFQLSPLNTPGAGTVSGDSGQTVTFTRSSAGTCKPTASTIAKLLADVPRVELTGLLMEPAATNVYLQSETMAASTLTSGGSGAPGNPTATTNSTDLNAPDGTQTSKKLVFPAVPAGGASPNYSILRQNMTFSAGVFSGGFWARTLTGTATIYISPVIFSDSTRAFTKTCNVTTTWQRFEGYGTNGASSGAGAFDFGVNLNDAAQSAQGAQTVYVWGVQAEAASHLSSYVPTTTVAVTRAVDVASVATSASWPKAAGEVYATVTPLWLATGATHSLVDTRDASNVGWYLSVDSSDRLSFFTSDGTGTTTLSSALTWTPGVAYECRAVWGAGAVTLYRDGVSVGSTASGADLPTAIRNTAYLGCNYSSANQLNGTLASVKVYV